VKRMAVINKTIVSVPPSMAEDTADMMVNYYIERHTVKARLKHIEQIYCCSDYQIPRRIPPRKIVIEETSSEKWTVLIWRGDGVVLSEELPFSPDMVKKRDEIAGN